MSLSQEGGSRKGQEFRVFGAPGGSKALLEAALVSLWTLLSLSWGGRRRGQGRQVPAVLYEGEKAVVAPKYGLSFSHPSCLP